MLRIFNRIPRHSFVKLDPKNVKTQPRLDSHSDLTRVISLNQQQLRILNSIPTYQSALQNLQKNNNFTALQLMQSLHKQISDSHPFHVKLQMYLLNRLSILYRLVEDNNAFMETLQDLYFMSVSYHGTQAAENVKHLNNLFLSFIHHDPMRAQALIQYLDQQIQKNNVPPSYRIPMKFFSSILYSIQDELPLAINNLQKVQPQNAHDRVIFNNNLTWMRLWAAPGHEMRRTLSQSLSSLGDCLRQAEYNDVDGCVFPRTEQQDTLIDHILQADISAKTKLRLEAIKLIHKHSHVLCMNLGELHFYSQAYDESSFWMQLAMAHATKLDEFDRVNRAMVFTAKIFDVNSVDQNAENVYLEVLTNSKYLPWYSKVFALRSYTEFLHKRERYLESDQYNEHILNYSQKLTRATGLEGRLENLLLPDYDFSF